MADFEVKAGLFLRSRRARFGTCVWRVGPETRWGWMLSPVDPTTRSPIVNTAGGVKGLFRSTEQIRERFEPVADQRTARERIMGL